MDRHHRCIVFARQRGRRRGPFRIGDRAVRRHAGQSSSREHDHAALGLEGFFRRQQGGAGLFAGALGHHPFDRDDGLAQPGRDPQGVGVGEEDGVGPARADGVEYGDSVGDSGRMVGHDDAAAADRNPLGIHHCDPQIHQVAHIVERLRAGQRTDRVSHPHRRAIVEQFVEDRPDDRPEQRPGQTRRALGDQHVADVRLRACRRGGDGLCHSTRLSPLAARTASGLAGAVAVLSLTSHRGRGG